MNSKLFILLIVNLSAVFAQLAIPGKLVGGAGLIGSRAIIGGAPIGAVAGLGYGGIGLAGPAVAKVGAIGLGGPLGLGAYGTGIAGLRLAQLGVGITHYAGPVPAAIETIRTHQVVDIPTPQDVIQPSTLIIEPNVMPVNIEFRSQSSPVNVNQVHIPGRPGIVERTSSEEEPDRLIHEVVKPVVQEVSEIIVPFRRITQEILPVQEEVHSLVARGQNQKVIAAEAPIGVGAVGVAGGLGLGAVGVTAPVAVGGYGGLITTGINRFAGAGLVNGGGLVGGGLVGGGLVGGGLVGGGTLISKNLELIKARS